MRVGRRIRPQVLAAMTQTRDVKLGVKTVAEKIRDDARALAPIRTGALRRSIVVRNFYDPTTQRVEYRVGWDKRIAPYGWVIEAGSEDTAPQPHLRPAANKYRRR